MKINYPDRWIQLLGIPLLGFFFRHIGESGTLISLLRQPVYYLDLLICIVGIGIVWQVIRQTILYLDTRYDWYQQPAERLAIQATVAYSFTALYVFLVSFVYNDLIIERPEYFNINFVFVTDVPVALLMATIIQLGYGVLYLRARLQQREAWWESQLASAKNHVHPNTTETPTPAESPYKKTLMAQLGKALVPIRVEDVAYIYKVNEVNIVRVFEGKEYVADDTLEKIEAGLSPEQYYRLNRQMIANRLAIRKMQQDASGKIALEMSPAFADEVTVSKKKAADFRAWMEW